MGHDTSDFIASVGSAIVLLILLFAAVAAYGQANCVEFGFTIPTQCCCTQSCCFEAKPGEVEHFYDDNYLIVPTGQEIKRSGWSEDGRTIRCACDQQPGGRWIPHLKARTHCLFVPRPVGS